MPVYRIPRQLVFPDPSLAEESGLDCRWSALFRVALDMGLRREELCGLRWSNIDFETGQVWVRRVRAVPTGKVAGCTGVVEREATKTEAKSAGIPLPIPARAASVSLREASHPPASSSCLRPDRPLRAV